jgi:class 3 adenylate cyclase
LVGFGIHLFVYAVGVSIVTAVWLLNGSHNFEDLRRILEDIPGDPSGAVDEGFWPLWVYLAWTAGLVIHFGVVLSVGLFGRRTRDHAKLVAKQAAQAAAQLTSRSARSVGPTSTEPTRQWVAVMFTDVVGSTAITENLGDEEWSRVLARHRDFVRQCFQSQGGTEVGTQGDGCLARFATPASAVTCAVDIQRQLQEVRDAADGFPLEVRIGIHAGDAVEHGGDLIGQVVNLASRVTNMAEPSEILVTEPVADHLDRDIKVEDRGLVDLRGVSQPRHLLAVRWD